MDSDIWQFLFCSFGSYDTEDGHANFSEIAGKCAEKRRGDVPKTSRKRPENEPERTEHVPETCRNLEIGMVAKVN